jgi:hypothetical protein
MNLLVGEELQIPPGSPSCPQCRTAQQDEADDGEIDHCGNADRQVEVAWVNTVKVFFN